MMQRHRGAMCKSFKLFKFCMHAVYMCVCVVVWAHACRFPPISSLCLTVLRQDLLLDLKLAGWGRLADQQAPEIHLSTPLPPKWDYRPVLQDSLPHWWLSRWRKPAGKECGQLGGMKDSKNPIHIQQGHKNSRQQSQRLQFWQSFSSTFRNRLFLGFPDKEWV